MKNLKTLFLEALKADKRKVSKDAKVGRLLTEIDKSILEARKEFQKRER